MGRILIAQVACEPSPVPSVVFKKARAARPCRGGAKLLEQAPKKLIDFFDANLLQHIDLARYLIDRMIPSGRKAR
jgi:hypothetical protein